MDLPRPVTWIRIVAARWLLVASSDEFVSELCCWNVKEALEGNTNPCARAYFHGPVETGEFEFNAEGLVIALGVNSK